MPGISGMIAPIADAVMLDELVVAHLAHIHAAFLRPAELARVEVDRARRGSRGRQLVPADVLRLRRTEKTSLSASGCPSGGSGFMR